MGTCNLQVLKFAASAVFAASVAAASTIDAPHVPGILLAQQGSWADPASVAQVLADNNAVILSTNTALNFIELSIDEEKRLQIHDNLEESGLFVYVEPDYLAHTGDPVPVANNPEPSTLVFAMSAFAALAVSRARTNRACRS